MVLAEIDPGGEMSRALRAAGLRVTQPRLAMLAWLARHPHSTVDAIAAGVRERSGTVSTRGRLRHAGRVRGRRAAAARPSPRAVRCGTSGASGTATTACVCRRCGRTEDVNRVTGYQPCLTPAEDTGFAVDEAEVVFWGVCPACKAAESSADGVQRDEEVWQ